MFSFCGKERSDTYAGSTATSPALISCTAERLSLEYGGYKNYVASSKKKQDCRARNGRAENHDEIKSCKGNKSSTKKEIKSLETELENIKNSREHPLSINDILEDNIVSSDFPSIRYLLKLFVLVPMSEAVVERGFSKNEINSNQ